MKLRAENTREDRSFNLACDILAFAARGRKSVGKKELRDSIRTAIGEDELSFLPLEKRRGDMRANGDAMNHLGLSDEWGLQPDSFKLSEKVLERCKHFLRFSNEYFTPKTDLFSHPFLIEKKIRVGSLNYNLKITRLEKGLTTGLVESGDIRFWFFTGTDVFLSQTMGVSTDLELLRKILNVYRDTCISDNPSGKVFDYSSLLVTSSKGEKRPHVRGPFIRLKSSVGRATVVRADKLSPSDRAIYETAAAELTRYANLFCQAHGYDKPESFRDFLNRKFGLRLK